MTGCDLRFAAEEAFRRFSDEAAARRDELRDTREAFVAILAAPISEVATLLATQADRLALAIERDRAETQQAVSHGYDVIEQIRSHFHEAVDQRVESEIEERGGVDEETVNERVNDACSELRDEIEDAVIRAVRNA